MYKNREAFLCLFVFFEVLVGVRTPVSLLLMISNVLLICNVLSRCCRAGCLFGICAEEP